MGKIFFLNVSRQALRTSALAAPIMELTGHSGEVFATRFDPYRPASRFRLHGPVHNVMEYLRTM